MRKTKTYIDSFVAMDKNLADRTSDQRKNPPLRKNVRRKDLFAWTAIFYSICESERGESKTNFMLDCNPFSKETIKVKKEHLLG